MEYDEALKKLEFEILNQSENSFYNWNYNYLINHKKRYAYDIKLIRKYYKSGKILEIGSAPYHLTYLLQNMNYPVVGVDIEPERFSQFISEKELKVLKCDIENTPLPFETNEFGFVIFNEIFEHLRINPITTLNEINRVMSRGGILMLTTPNLYSIRNIVNFLLGRGFDDPYHEFMKLYKLGHMGHVREYSVKQLKKFLVNTGFESTYVTLKSYNPLKGLWTPFNYLRKLIPAFHRYQIHISKKNV